MRHLMIPIVSDEPEYRETTARGVLGKSLNGGEYVPLLSWQATGAMTLCLCCAHLLTDENVVWQVRIGAEVDGADWTAAVTGALFDTQATGIGGGGRVVAAGLASTTGSVGAATQIVSGVEYTLTAGETLSLCVRQLSGTGGIVSATATWSEA